MYDAQLSDEYFRSGFNIKTNRIIFRRSSNPVKCFFKRMNNFVAVSVECFCEIIIGYFFKELSALCVSTNFNILF